MLYQHGAVGILGRYFLKYLFEYWPKIFHLILPVTLQHSDQTVCCPYFGKHLSLCGVLVLCDKYETKQVGYLLFLNLRFRQAKACSF